MVGNSSWKLKGFGFAIGHDGGVISAPLIRDAIYGGSAEITGWFCEQEARNLASVLENPLQTPVRIEEQRSVSPTLGADSIRHGVQASVLSLLVVMLFMLFYYRLSGANAVVALILNLVILLAVLALAGAVLTLPGIAGVILTIGMGVDSTVLVV